MNLKIAEVFTSPQGEGRMTGTMMRFVRLSGCTVFACQFHPANPTRVADCDTDWRFTARQDVDALADEALLSIGRGGWACITGGEPLDQSEGVGELIYRLHRRGLKANVQTSGTRQVPFECDWLTVSPKCHEAALAQRSGDEMKVVYSGQPDDEIAAFETLAFQAHYLMPTWKDGAHNVHQTIAAIDRLNKDGGSWALTTQTHKWLGVR